MRKDDLPPVSLTQRRYASSIPSGKISVFSPTQVPIINRMSAASKNGASLSMHQLTDPSVIDQKLKSLSHADSDMRISLELDKKQKANLKFLRYKFNPGSQEQESENIQKGNVQHYGQLGKQNKLKISVNVFYQFKNVLFQDERAPLVYKKLFLAKEQAS